MSTRRVRSSRPRSRAPWAGNSPSCRRCHRCHSGGARRKRRSAMVYPRQRSNFWYLKRWPYRIFILREFSAVFLAGFMVEMLLLVKSVHDGPAAFSDFVDTLQSPVMLIVNTIILLFALLHTAPWFMAVPSAMQIRRGEEKVPPQILIGGAYMVLLGASAAAPPLVMVGRLGNYAA